MKKFRKWIPLFLFLGLLPALLTGCNPESGTSYEIIYPSGLSRGPCDWEDVVPVEGAPYQLTSGKSENFEKTAPMIYGFWMKTAKCCTSTRSWAIAWSAVRRVIRKIPFG